MLYISGSCLFISAVSMVIDRPLKVTELLTKQKNGNSSTVYKGTFVCCFLTFIELIR